MSMLQQQFQVYWSIPWLRRTVISAICILIILLLIPIIVQFTIIHLLEKQGADQADINDININLFAGTVELNELTFSKAGHNPARITHLSSNLNMLELLSSRIVFSDIQLHGVNIEVKKDENNSLFINGLPVIQESTPDAQKPVASAEKSEPLEFALNKIELNNIEAYYAEPDFNQRGIISSLILTDLKSWDTSSPADLKLEGTLNESPLSLSAELNLFDEIKSIKGTTSLKSVGFSPYAKFYRQHINTLEGNINLESNFDISLSENITARIENNLEITNLHALYQSIDHRSDKIEWKGLTELQANGQVSIQGDLAISGSKTQDNIQNYQIASFSQLSLTDIRQNAKEIGLGSLTLNDMEFINLKDKQSFVKIRNVNLKELNFNQDLSQLKIARIEVTKPEIKIEITDKKQLSFLVPLQGTIDELIKPSGDKKEPAQSSSKSKEKPLALTIKNFTLIEPGMVDFSDNSVNPNYNTQITLDKVILDNISSKDTAEFDIAIKQAQYTLIDIQGNGLLLDPTGKLELKAKIKQLDLPPVTPYTSNAMGYGMKSGMVDSDIELKINKREIDSVVDLKIDSIEVVETDTNTAEQISSASGMSIDLAVSTLKDKNNIIELKLPIKGNLDKPDFDLSLIINKAMGKAMQTASLSYLKHALQPFGSLVTLFSLAKAAANHISLPPILFETNSLQLKGQQKDLLDKVLKVLSERPALKIKACGVSALEDKEAINAVLIAEEKARLQEIAKQKAQNQKSEKEIKENPPLEIVIADALIKQRMRDLADQRSAWVKAYFLEQGKLDSARILNCLSSSNTDKDSKPSVEMQL